MKTPTNPFVLSGYYGKKWFCDREEELEMLMEHLQNGRNVVLYSWRRMGKTALIRQVFDEAERHNETESVYVDLLATQDLEEAVRAITIAVHQTYGRTSAGLPSALRKLFSGIGATISFDPLNGIPEISLGLRETTVPERSFEAIGQFLSKRKKQVIIALDEFQQISGYKEKNAEAVFRAWMQNFPHIRFIYSGSHRGMMQAMFTEKKRPFYHSSQLMALNPINENDYTKFIQGHFSDNKKSINEQSIHRVYQWSRGQTYCIQLICNNLYGKNKNVNIEDIETVTDRMLEQEAPIFANYQKMLAGKQWDLLKAIAKEMPLKNPLGMAFNSKYQLGAPSSVSTALNALQKKELVIQENGHYFVHDALLARWLERL